MLLAGDGVDAQGPDGEPEHGDTFWVVFHPGLNEVRVRVPRLPSSLDAHFEIVVDTGSWEVPRAPGQAISPATLLLVPPLSVLVLRAFP